MKDLAKDGKLDPEVFRAGFVNELECVFGDGYSSAEQIDGYPYRYYINHGEEGDPAVVTKALHPVNCWGTAYFRAPLELDGHGVLDVTDYYWEEI